MVAFAVLYVAAAYDRFHFGRTVRHHNPAIDVNDYKPSKVPLLVLRWDSKVRLENFRLL